MSLYRFSKMVAEREVADFILEVFEEQEELFHFPVCTQKEARAFVKALHSKGLGYSAMCEEIGEFEHNFCSWRKGLGRQGVGNRIIEMINRPFHDVLYSDEESSSGEDEEDGKIPVKKEAAVKPVIGRKKEVPKEEKKVVPKEEKKEVSKEEKKEVPKEAKRESVEKTETETNLVKGETAVEKEETAVEKKNPEVEIKEAVVEKEKTNIETKEPEVEEKRESEVESMLAAIQAEEAIRKSRVNQLIEEELALAPPPVQKDITDSLSDKIKFMDDDEEEEEEEGDRDDKDVGESEGSASYKTISSSESRESSVASTASSSSRSSPSVEREVPKVEAKVAEPPAAKKVEGVMTNGRSGPPVKRTTSNEGSISPDSSSVVGTEINENYDSDLDIEDVDLNDPKGALIRQVMTTIKSEDCDDGPGYIFVFSDSSKFAREHRLKVGCSRFPNKRLEQAMHFNVDIKMVSSVAVSERRAALQSVFTKMRAHKMEGQEDWFKAPLDTALAIVTETAKKFSNESNC